MSENLRSLIVILVLSTSFFAFSGKVITEIIDKKHFTTRRNLWFGITVSAFLAPNFWIYAFIAILMLRYTQKQEANIPALFFFILFAVPMANAEIPGFGLINYFFDISHARLLALFLLLPATLKLFRDHKTLPLGRIWPDKLLISYLILTAILHLRDSSFTDTLRQTSYLIMDMFLPYYVISRSLNNMQVYKDAVASLVLIIMLIALLAGFESYKQWLLYTPLIDHLELKQGMTGYLVRDGLIRVMASAGFSISLGYLMAVGIGFYLYLQNFIKNRNHKWLGLLLLIIGLIVPWSRGPWMGAILLLIVFIATGRKAIKRLSLLAMAGLVTLALLPMFPGGERVINLLPIIGKTEQSTIEYRNDLITVSLINIQRNPWFGSVNYLDEPEWQPLYINHMIDIVNTYFQVALEEGLIALGLFVGFFVSVVWGLLRTLKSIPDKESEEYLLGRSLLATQLAILFIIFTVSNITIIPIVYWSVAAMGVAYMQMIRNGRKISISRTHQYN